MMFNWFAFGMGVGLVNAGCLFLVLFLARASAARENGETLRLMRERNELDAQKVNAIRAVEAAIWGQHGKADEC